MDRQGVESKMSDTAAKTGNAVNDLAAQTETVV
jgi:hypothetical protein